MVDGFANAFLGDVDFGFLMFFNQAGSLFGAFWDHFGRLWLLVATFQAHLVPGSLKLTNFVKKRRQTGSHFGSLSEALGTIGLHSGAHWSKNDDKSGSKLRFVDFAEMSVFPR